MQEPEQDFRLIGFCVSVPSRVGRTGISAVFLRDGGEQGWPARGFPPAQLLLLPAAKVLSRPSGWKGPKQHVPIIQITSVLPKP